jgi:hypothetical protein
MIYNNNLKIMLSGQQYKQLSKLFFSSIISAFLFLFPSSCKKLVDIPPPTQNLAENKVYAVDATAIGVLDGMYANLTLDNNLFEGGSSIGVLIGLSADELNVFGTSNPYYSYYINNLSMLVSGYEFWAPLYNDVYECNAAIEGLQKSTTLSPVVKQQLLGEAKFMRAFFYFYLVNLFGDVPLALSTNAVLNTALQRSPKTDVYTQIIADLKDAKDLLSSTYPDATLFGTTSERIRLTKWAAAALLARAYLYFGNLTGDASNYSNAESEASTLLNNSGLYNLVSLNSVFLKNSSEAIWQLQPTTNNLNTVEGRLYVIPPTGPSTSFNPVFLSKFLLNSFEPGDQRAVLGNWVNTTIYKKTTTTYDTVPYSSKYKIYAAPGVTSAVAMTEYFMVLRLGEQYLIRAEARAQQNNISGAQSDLNAIRTRAGLTNTTASDKTSLLAAILDERRHELFCEWGNRWLDLKRTGKVDAVMNVITPLKSNGTIAWRPYQQLFPIKKTELDKAPNLTQNNGY